MEFKPFDKIARLRRGCFITEKIDGTNAQIYITDDGNFLIGSRNRWITPDDDNIGFAGWAVQNKEELLKLGPGQHFGEWWGAGIQRRYGLTEKRFSLFNSYRWEEAYLAMLKGYDNNFPKCCHVVPTLYKGPFDTSAIDLVLKHLKEEGSRAAPGFMDPEGIIIYHEAGRCYFKQTIEKDEEPKSLSK